MKKLQNNNQFEDDTIKKNLKEVDQMKMRAKCIRSFVENNKEITTVGLVYNVNHGLSGYYLLDDYGDILYLDMKYFEWV